VNNASLVWGNRTDLIFELIELDLSCVDDFDGHLDQYRMS